MRKVITVIIMFIITLTSGACVPDDPDMVWYTSDGAQYTMAEIQASPTLAHEVVAWCNYKNVARRYTMVQAIPMHKACGPTSQWVYDNVPMDTRFPANAYGE